MKRALILSDEPGFSLSTMRLLAKKEFTSFLMKRGPKDYSSYSRYCSDFFDLPKNQLSEKKLIEKIIDKTKQHKIDFIFPTTNNWISLCSANKDILEKNTKLSPVPPPESMKTVLNKTNFYQFALKNKIPVPEFNIYNDIESALDFTKPFVVRAKTGKHLVKERKDLEKMNLEPEAIIQSYVPGTDIDVSIIALNGRILQGIVQENYKEEPNLSGLPVAIRFINDDEALNIARDIISKLKWSGIAHIDMRRDKETGRLVVFEINPRLWASHVIAYTAYGFNPPYLSYQATCNKIKEEALPLPRKNYYYISPKYFIKHPGRIAQLLKFKPKRIMPLLAFQDLTDLKPIFKRFLHLSA